MTRTVKHSHHFRDPNARLSSALDTLEKFTTRNAKGPIPHIYRYTKDQTLFKKIMSFTKNYVAATFSEKVRKKNELERNKAEEEVWNAIDDVKRYHPLICKKNSSKEKILASRAIATIQNFNRAIESAEQQSSCWHKRLLLFLIKRSRLSFAKTRKVEISSPSSDKITTFVEKNNFKKSLTERETDAFRMKGISLIQNHGILFPSIKEILSSLRESPIYTTPPQDAMPASSILCLEQTLSPFPGETIIIRGAFKREANEITPSTPIPDSFELTTQSIQTGFPYPSQHTGWTLAEPLIAPPPHRLEELKSLPPLIGKKENAARALSEKTPLLAKAKEGLKRKLEAMKSHKKEFLLLHRKLCLGILLSAPRDLITNDDENTITRYFKWLSDQSQIARGYHELNQRFIIRPFEALSLAWTKQTNKELLCNDPKRSYAAAKEILRYALATALNELRQNHT
ncbi:MAG: hypothetical protein ACE5GN_05610, partial [Waddliaceae bacterium]